GENAAGVDLDRVVEQRGAVELAAQARPVAAGPLAVAAEHDELARVRGRARGELELERRLEVAVRGEDHRLGRPREPAAGSDAHAHDVARGLLARVGERGRVADELERRARSDVDV